MRARHRCPCEQAQASVYTRALSLARTLRHVCTDERALEKRPPTAEREHVRDGARGKESGRMIKKKRREKKGERGRERAGEKEGRRQNARIDRHIYA